MSECFRADTPMKERMRNAPAIIMETMTVDANLRSKLLKPNANVTNNQVTQAKK